MLGLQLLAIFLVRYLGKCSLEQYSCNMRKINMSHCHDSYRKVPATNTYGITTISGKGNVEDIMIKCLIIRKDDVIPYSKTVVIMTVFYGHIL